MATRTHMYRIMTGATMAMALCFAAGCRSTKVESKDTPFGNMQKAASKINENGGFAAVGIGQSRTAQGAIQEAKLYARTELAEMLETKIEALQKNFVEEVGEGSRAEYNALFSTVTKSITSQVLRGTVSRDVKYVTASGQTMAYALVMQDPGMLKRIFEEQAGRQQALYTRFRASQAFQELEKEIERYEQFKKNDQTLFMQGTAPGE